MTEGLRKALIGLVIVGLYAGFVAAIINWMRSRLMRRATAGFAALEKLGARSVAARRPSGYRQPAEIEFELAGMSARFQVQQYGRDYIRQSIRLPPAPLPGILVRPERAMDRFGKSMGLNREVQLGDEAFDKAAYIESSASDETVRSAFAQPEIRAQVLQLLRLGYDLDMSSDGLGASRLRGYYASFESPELPDVLRTLQEIRAALPSFDPSKAGANPRTRLSRPVFVAFVGVVLGVASFALVPFVHPPMDDADSIKIFGLGVLAWLVVVGALFAAFRGRPAGLQEWVVVSLLLLFAVTPLTALAIFAANSGLDGGPVTTHRVQIMRMYRHDHEVWFASWRPGRARDKVGVAWPVYRTLNVGDWIDIDTRPGALGWMWVPTVRRVP